MAISDIGTQLFLRILSAISLLGDGREGRPHLLFSPLTVRMLRVLRVADGFASLQLSHIMMDI